MKINLTEVVVAFLDAKGYISSVINDPIFGNIVTIHLKNGRILDFQMDEELGIIKIWYGSNEPLKLPIHASNFLNRVESTLFWLNS